MKGSIIGYGAILGVLIIGSFVIIFVTQTGLEEAAVVSREGQLISFGNYGHFFVKMLDQSIYFISQRAAYDLGKTGGIEGSEVALWDENYPSIEELKENLKNKINSTLSSSKIVGVKKVIWRETNINIKPQEPLTNSEYFTVDGIKSFSIYSELIDSTISLDHEIDSRIDSNYFKLLNAGRTIFDSGFIEYQSDYVLLLNKLNNEFDDVSFAGWLVSDDIVEISIVQYCYPYDIYCLSPLKSHETSMLGSIPYEYVELRLRYQKEQTGNTDPTFDFELEIIPSTGTLKVVCV